MKSLKSFLMGAVLWIGILINKAKTGIKNRAILRQKLASRALFEKKQRERYLFHQMLKAGDSYRLGECTVTLMEYGIVGKAQVAERIEAANKRRAKRLELLTNRGQEMMLMSPEELEKFQIEQWLLNRRLWNEKKHYESLSDKMPTDLTVN